MTVLEAEILAEFRHTAQTHRAEVSEQLSAIANAATGLDISVYEAKGWGIWMLAFLAAVFVSVVPVVSLLAGRQESPFGAAFAWCMAASSLTGGSVVRAISPRKPKRPGTWVGPLRAGFSNRPSVSRR